MASVPSAVWAFTRPTGMSNRPAPGSSDRASRGRVGTTSTTARTSRMAETTFADTGSLWRIGHRCAGAVHFVTFVVQLGGQQVDQGIHLAGPVTTHSGVEAQSPQVVPGDRPVRG